jgi:hypothetical protein
VLYQHQVGVGQFQNLVFNWPFWLALIPAALLLLATRRSRIWRPTSAVLAALNCCVFMLAAGIFVHDRLYVYEERLPLGLSLYNSSSYAAGFLSLLAIGLIALARSIEEISSPIAHGFDVIYSAAAKLDE